MAWNATHLENVLRDLRRFGSDSTLIECKRAGNGVHDDTLESIAAFANMPEGGTLLLGVEENANFRVTGVDDPASMESDVANRVRQAIKPAPMLNFFPVSLSGRVVLVVEVVPLLPSQKPALFQKKAYLRQSDGDYVMNSNDLRMIHIAALHDRELVHHDVTILKGTSTSELDPNLVEEYLRTVREKNARVATITNDAQLLQVTHVTDSEGQLRLGGLYAMGFLPEAMFPSLTATAAVRVPEDGTGVRTRDLQDFGGPIPILLEETMEWVRKNTVEERAYVESGHMERRTEFPMAAIRELLANAFVHRDLSPQTVDVGKRVEIRILPDRLIIKSPGGLRGLSKAQLESADLTKVAVNQRVYEMTKCLNTSDGQPIIEGEGGGIPVVYNAMRAAGKPDPRFFDNGVEFTVQLLRASRYDKEETAWLDSLDAKMSWMQKEILIGLRRGETWSLSMALKEFNRTREWDVRRAIDGLLELRIIRESEGVLALEAGSLAHSETDARNPQRPSDKEEPEDRLDVAPLGRNSATIYEAIIAGHDTVKAIAKTTGLKEGQVRYSLKRLLEAEVITMLGGQGVRGTRYVTREQGGS